MRPVDVSVIIPVHNRAELLAQALASVASSAAGSDRVELVVCDDASDPTEAARIVSLCARAPNCTYRRIATNGGPQLARNLGLEIAAGRYVKFLDSDDILLPGALGAEVASLNTSGADILVSGWLRTSIDDERLDQATRGAPKPWPGNPYDAVLTGFGAPISSVLYKRSAIGQVRWDPTLRHPDDWFFLVRVLLQAPRVTVSETPVFIWREHAGARQSGTSMIDYARSRARILDFARDGMNSAGELTPERRRVLAGYYCRDLYVAHRFDRDHYHGLLARVDDLCAGSAPPGRVEGSPVSYALRRALGYRVYVPLHNFMRRALGRPAHRP